MKQFSKAVFALFLSSIFFFSLNAQIGDIDDLLGGIKIGSKFEAYENPIKMNITMDVTTVNRKGKSEETVIEYTFDTWATAMVVTSKDNYVKMLLDNQEGYYTMITEDKGELQGIRMRQRSINIDAFMPDEDEFTVTETGNTRTIDGYECKEYLIVHEDGTTNSWVTEDLDVDMLMLSKALASQGKNKQVPTQNYFDLQGFPIEATTVSKNGKETTTIHFHKITLGDDIDLNVFDTTGIDIMSMGF